MQRAERDIAAIKSSMVQTQAHTQYREQERGKLQEDLQGYQRDAAKLTDLVAAMESRKADLREELSQLYQTNLALDQQLKEYSAKLTEEINRQTAEVALIQSP
jgi:hypothetical protein